MIARDLDLLRFFEVIEGRVAGVILEEVSKVDYLPHYSSSFPHYPLLEDIDVTVVAVEDEED